MEVIGYLIFVSIFYLTLYLTKKGEWIGGIFGIKIRNYNKIVEFCKKHEKAIRIFSKISLISMLFLIPYSFYILFSYFIEAMKAEVKTPGVSLIIPGAKIPGTEIRVPLIEGVIAIFLTAFFHEISHALVSIQRGIKIKGIGFGFFLIFPVAFVDLDEEELKKRIEDLPYVASAGPLANVILATIFFLLLLLVSKIYKDNIIEVGVKVIKSENVNLTPGEIIYEVNGKRIKNIYDLREIMKNVTPGSTIIVKTNLGEKMVKTRNVNGRAYIGIVVKNEVKAKSKFFEKVMGFILFLGNLFYWCYFINYAVGLFNAYPLPFLDGSLYLAAMLKKYIRDEKIFNYVMITISLICIGILLGVVFIPLLR